MLDLRERLDRFSISAFQDMKARLILDARMDVVSARRALYDVGVLLRASPGKYSAKEVANMLSEKEMELEIARDNFTAAQVIASFIEPHGKSPVSLD